MIRMPKTLHLTCFAIITLLLLNIRVATAQIAEVNANTFSDTLLCVKGSFNVPIIISSGTFDDTNTFKIEISNSVGSFSNPKLVGIRSGSNGGIATCTLPSTITPGTGYKIRVISTYPTMTPQVYSKPIRVSDYPNVSVGIVNSSLCEGDTIMLTSGTTSPQPTYSWTGPNGYSSTGQQNPIIFNTTPNNSGTYKVTVTSYKCATTDTIAVFVSPKPKINYITAPSSICEGDELSITYTCHICNTLPANNTTRTWTRPNNSTTTNGGIYYAVAKLSDAGTYKLQINIGNCIDTASAKVSIRPAPDTPSASNNGPLCVGETLELDGSTTTPGPGLSYKWTGPNGYYDSGTTAKSTLPNIPKAAEGDYTLYAIKDGCYSSPGTKSITKLIVGVPLTQLTISGDTMLCPGEKLQLSTQTQTTQGIEWIKLPDSNIVSINRSFAINNVSGSDAGVYSVTQEVLGCKSPPAYITVHIPDIKAPDANNNGPLCPGDKLILSSVSSDNATYSWTGPAGFSSSSANSEIENVTEENEGMYNITTNLEYCTRTDATEVIVKPKPTITNISSNSPVCTYTYLNLFAESNIPNSTYEWSGPAGFYDTNQSPSLFFLDNITGNYSVKAIADGCSSEPATTEVLTKEGPGITKARSNAPITEGNVLNLFAENTKDSVQFIWTGPEEFESDKQNPSIPVSTYRNSGEYEVLSIYNTCTTSVKTHVVVKDILGITLDVYPNPNDGAFKVKGITQTDAKILLNIYNHQGGVVYKDEIIPDKSKFQTEIDLTGSPSGVYILQVIAGGEKKTVRFTIIKQ